MFSFYTNQRVCHDLVIIGSGGAGTAAFIQTVRELEKEKSKIKLSQVSITLLERSDTAGSGYPYNPAVHKSTLKVNDSNRGMILIKDNPDDFMAWLKENSEALKLRHPELAQLIDNNVNGKDRYAPRMLFGEYCQARLKDYIEVATKLGITVKIEKNVEIIDVIQDADENWYLKTKDGKTRAAKNLLVATGHMPSDKFPTLESLPNYFNSPFQDLSSLPKAPVIVLGSGLSAIDTAKLLALQQVDQPIYFVSPSGQLPRIKGPATSIVYQMKFLTRENLNKKNIRLAEVMQLFVEEVKFATNNSSLNLQTIMKHVRQEDEDPCQSFKNEIALIEKGELRGWQLMIGETWYEALPLIWQHLDDRDRKEFISDYFPFFMKWAAGMTLSNAKEIEQLIDKNQLTLIKTSEPVTYDEKTKLYHVKISQSQEITAGSVINGTGTGYNIRMNDTLHAMTKRGLIKPAQYIGGVDISNNFQLLDCTNQPHKNAWGIGVVTYGCNLSANSIEIAAMDAQVVVPQIVSNIKIAHEPQKTQTVSNNGLKYYSQQ